MNATPTALVAALVCFPVVLSGQTPPPPAKAAVARDKPVHYQIPPGWERQVVTVKFRDGLAIRLRDGALTDVANRGALDAAAVVLEAMRRGTWSRTHTLAEGELDRMREIGERNTGAPLSDLNLQFRCHLPADVDAVPLIDALNALDCVEMAESIPGYAPLPQAPDLRAKQSYSEAAPRGTGAGTFQGFADMNPSINLAACGGYARIVDIEYAFDPGHMDLLPIGTLTPIGYSSPGDANHGTAVLGQLSARNDGVGTTGIAHAAQMSFAYARTPAYPGHPFGDYSVDSAVSTAASYLASGGGGGVILIEQQIGGPRWNGQSTSQFGLLPVEGHGPTWQAIETAVAMGVVVVEAAGNGSQNLDDPIYNGWFSIPHDSGAILVGAGGAPSGTAARARLSFSNYGESLDLQGPGELVVTTGYGDLYSAGGPNATYTQVFGGTSSASPVVAGACALIQSLHFDRTGSYLQPAALRAALRRSGTPQAGAPFVADNIGPLPDVVKTALDLRLYRGLELAHGFAPPLPLLGGQGLDPAPFAGPSVVAMVEFDDDGPGPRPTSLYVGGQFTKAGEVPANNIACWNGVGWSALGSGVTLSGVQGFHGSVQALAVYDPDGPGAALPALYVGGTFNQAGGITTWGIARWNGTSWSSVGGGATGYGNSVYSLAVFDEDGAGPLPLSLIAGGDITAMGGVATPKIARWRNDGFGHVWSSMGNGFDDRVDALEVYDADGTGPLPAELIAAGLFRNTSGGSPMRAIARWDGFNWLELGGGADSNIWALEAVNVGPGQQQLFVGGSFYTLGGTLVPTQGSGIWNGSWWTYQAFPVQQPLAIRAFDDGTHTSLPRRDNVYLATSSGQLVRWDPVTLTSTGLPISGTLQHLTVFDEDGVGGAPAALFLGGSIVTGSTNSAGIAKLLGGSPITTTGYLLISTNACGGPYRPTIATTGEPVLGQPFTVQFDSLPQSLPVLLVGPPQPMPVPLCSGQSNCILGTQLDMILFGASATFMVPSDPFLIGATAAFQGVEINPLPYGSMCTPPYVPFALRTTDTLWATF